MSNDRFHACATCINFRTEKAEGRMKYFCSRLGFETKTNYQFDCWDPKENVKKLMAKNNPKIEE